MVRHTARVLNCCLRCGKINDHLFQKNVFHDRRELPAVRLSRFATDQYSFRARINVFWLRDNIFYNRIVHLRLQHSQYILQVYMKTRHSQYSGLIGRARSEQQSCEDTLVNFYPESFHNKDELLRSLATVQYYYQALQISLSDMVVMANYEPFLQHFVAEMQLENTKQDQARQKREVFNKNVILFRKSFGQLRLLPSQLFLVLPTRVAHWKLLDPATHTFRLYFLCDNAPHHQWRTNNNPPYHAHISSHSGYDINKPQ